MVGHFVARRMDRLPDEPRPGTLRMISDNQVNLKMAIEAKILMKTIAQKLVFDQYAITKKVIKVIMEQLIFHGLSMCCFDSANSIYVSRTQRVIANMLHEKLRVLMLLSTRMMVKASGLSRSAMMRIWHAFVLQPP